MEQPAATTSDAHSVKQDPPDFSAAAAALRSARRVWIGTHVDPDGDAIGSLLGLGLALEATGHEVTMSCQDGPPREVDFLPSLDRIVAVGPAIDRHDLAVALDTADASRLGDLYEDDTWTSIPTLVIDHHVSNPGFGSINLIDPSAASTAEMIAGLLKEMAIAPNEQAATCLLTGVVTDTIGFRTTSTTAGTLNAAHVMMTAGADLSVIMQRVFYRRPLAGLRLLGRALERITLQDDVALTMIRHADMQEFGATADDARGISSVLATAEEARVIAVLRERDDGLIDVSLRAKPGVNLIPVVSAFGGGGHPVAAGAKLPGPIEEAAATLLRALANIPANP